MISVLAKYKRGLITALLSLLFLLGCIDASTEGKAYFNIFALTLTVVICYPIAVWYLEKKDLIDPREGWKRKELLLLSALISAMLFLGLGETNERDPVMTMGYAFSILLVFAYNCFYFYKRPSARIPFNKNFFKQHVKAIIVSTGAIVLIGLMFYFKEHKEHEELFEIWRILFFLLIGYIVFPWLLQQWKDIRQLRHEKTKAELLHLKSQINPHFFFNTLNNLYGLINKHPTEARELVLKLSEMMRYTIYEGKKDKVLLTEELAYLKHYINLHQSRYHKDIEVLFKHHIQREDYQIMPLLFIILLENAFKHGAENLREDAYIHIELKAADNRLDFTIENNFDEKELPEKEGIGLENLKRRLELAYPDQYQLSSITTKNVYKAQLHLTLA